MTPVRQRLRQLPAPVVDAGLAVAVAVAITIAIAVTPERGARRDALAFALGLAIAALVLVRRRWPLAVLALSVATLQLYYVLGYPGVFPAVPLAVALATAWAAGHQRWALLVAAWYGAGPLSFRIWADPEPLPRVLNDSVPDLALFAAVLLLGEAVRTRRALAVEQEKSERLLLNVLPASIAARLKQTESVIADGFPEVTVLFADLVDFTRRSEQTAPEQVVRFLNELFSVFDQLAQQRGLEKVKTIGDAYMVVGGLPDPRPDHAEAVAEMALAMRVEQLRSDAVVQAMWAEEIARRTGTNPQRDLYPRLAAAALISTVRAALDHWLDADPATPLHAVVSQALQQLADGLPAPGEHERTAP